MKKYACSSCGKDGDRGDFHEAHYRDRQREVTSQCRLCRSNGYFRSRYKTICLQCQQPRPLNQNKVCKHCNEDSGLRECRGSCGEILPAALSFDGKRTTCKACRKLKQPEASGASAADARPTA